MKDQDSQGEHSRYHLRSYGYTIPHYHGYAVHTALPTTLRVQKSGSKAKRSLFTDLRTFQPKGTLSVKTVVEKRQLFHSLLFTFLLYPFFFEKSTNFYYFCAFNKSRISAKRTVFAIAFSSAIRAASAACSAAMRSSSAFAAFAASKRSK